MSKLALVDWRLPVCGSDAIHFCAANGISALQIDFGGPGRAPTLDNQEKQEAILNACSLYNITLLALSANQFNDIGFKFKFSQAGSKQIQKLIISILNVAYLFSVPLVFFPSFHVGIIRDRATLMLTARYFRWACREAQDRKLLLANENDLPVSWARQLIDLVDSKNFRLIFDSYNYIKTGCSANQVLLELDGYFAPQVHIKEGLNLESGKVSFGHGDGNVFSIINTLQKKNWVKWYVLENDYRSCGLRMLHNDIKWIKNCLKISSHKKREGEEHEFK